MQRVLVLDRNKQPLMPCHPARARELLRKGKEAVFRRYPFTLIILDREGGDVQPVAFKIDPGSKQTGMVLVGDFKRGKRVEYLLEKFNRQCAYCKAKDMPMEVEHIIPKSRGGSDRVSNLTLACHDCNQRKGDQTAAEFGHPEVQKRAKAPLKDAMAVNATRWALFHPLQTAGLPLEVSTGGRTKFNRVQQNYPKTHWIDAACVGVSGARVYLSPEHQPLLIKAMGHGNRQICRTDKFGFPSRHRLRQKRHFGFQTGDIVKAIAPGGKYKGKHVGRVACRATGKFDITTAAGKVNVSHKHCRAIHHADGYTYLKGEASPPPANGRVN
jgi:hypothetical protein